ncbi:MAG: hypothetical protein K9L59_07870 [Desulfobacterales bacterium]|nr:hypothetical protein [Desulfobacterales bacterium]
MERDVNPLNEDGSRNLFCPQYRQCLDYAVTNQWLFWSCEGCVHRHEAEPFTDGLLTCAEPYPVYVLPKSLLRIEG